MSAREPQLDLPGYTIRRCIGAGGMGEVFEAVDEALGRPVAIKRLRGDRINAESPAFGTWQARFRREARLLAAVKHPNIAVVHSVVERDGSLYMVMEYVEGRSLREALKAGPLSVGDAIEVCRQVAAGLMAAHDAGVIHRDIKPDNIRIGKDGRVRILDFGLARQVGPETGADAAASTLMSEPTTVLGTRAGAFLGTPGYAAPEQVMGEAVDQRADVFGFGCVLYECLCGQRAFEARGKHGADVVMMEEPAWGLLPEGLPASMRGLLSACLARSVTDRPSGLAEVLAVLARGQTSPRGAVTHGAVRCASNLPGPEGGFVGRASQSARLIELVHRERLVTITGLGGSGKTRLALHVAGQAVSSPQAPGAAGSDGVFLIALGGVSSRRQLMHAMARAVSIRGGRVGVDEELARLIEHIGEQRILLLLDQCEHLAAEVRGVCERLISDCPRLRILATSRERLGSPGEQVFALGPLACRAKPAGRTASRGSTGRSSPVSRGRAGPSPSEAAELFIQRARRAAPDIEIGGPELASVERLCARIGGWPLAIEVAAALTETLRIQELEARICGDPGIVLEPATSNASEGRTVASVIDWTFARLTPAERLLLFRLTVIPGDFTLDAAEATGADQDSVTEGRIAKRSVLGLMSSLVRRSLVVRRDPTDRPGDSRDPRTRYDLLDPIREACRRIATPEEHADLDRARERMSLHALGLVEASAARLEGAGHDEWIARLEADYAMIREAFAWSVASGRELRRAMEAAAALAPFWYKTWMVAEGRATLEQAISAAGGLGAPGREDLALLRATKAAGILFWMSGDRAGARDWYAIALRIAVAIADSGQEASLSSNLGLLLAEEGDAEGACGAHERSVAIYERLGDAVRAEQAALNLAAAEIHAGRLSVAKARLERCLSGFRARGDEVRASVALTDLGEIEFREGDYKAAWSRFREAFAMASRTGSAPGRFTATTMLGLCAARLGCPRTAASLLGFVARTLDGSRLGGQDELTVQAMETYEQLMNHDAGGELEAVAGAIERWSEVDAIIASKVDLSDEPVK